MRFAVAFAIGLSGAALLAPAVGAAPVQSQQVEPERTVEARATLAVRVTCADGKAVPSGVELRAVAIGESGAPIDRARLAGALAGAASGERRRDDRGASGGATFDVARPAGTLVVVASAAGLYAERAVAADDAGPVELELRADRSFEVRVVDERGRPVARVPVAIAAFDTWGELPDVLSDRATKFPLVVWTGDRDGVARFDHVEEWIDPDRETDSIALLAIPHRDHEQRRITPTLLEQGSVELHAPQFGAVELRFPGVKKAAVRLRERPAPLDPDGGYRHLLGPGEWRRGEPLELDVVDGVARCDRVGVGCTLEVEALWSGLSTPFRAEFAGPDRAGASVAWSLVAEGEDVHAITARLTGRLIDGARRPLASRVLHGRIVAWEQGLVRSDEELSVVTDSAGRFELELGPRAPAAGVKRWLGIGEAAVAGDDDDTRRGARGWIEVTGRLGARSDDLGDLLLVGADAKPRVAAQSDEALLAETAAVRAWPDDAPSRQATLDLRLNEMARRGGSRVVSFLELEITRQREEATRDHEAEIAACEEARARLKAAGKENDESGEDDEAALTARIDAAADWKFPVDLKWAALLRRAQRRPAPIVLEPVEPGAEAVTPATPEVRLRIHDVDAGFERIAVPRLDESCWRTSVFDHEGKVVPEPSDDPWLLMRGPWAAGAGSELESDDSYVDRSPLGRRFERVRPGEYHVRVEYMIGDVAAITSGDLPVRVLPFPIRVSRRDYDAMVAWIRAIDVMKPVPLTRSPIARDDEFTTDAEMPEDRIARCGRLALPALLDELEETTDEPRRRAWILGLLWNTQVDRVITCEQIEAAVGSFEWSYRWPTVQPHGDDSGGRELLPGRRHRDPDVPRDAAPDRGVQRDLAAIWADLRGWFDFKIED